MKLLLSEYLRTLKERNELDVLLPELLFSMGIIPITKTQTGTRQFGVDLAAVGIDPGSNKKSLFLFVIKKGDVGRASWDNGTQSIRKSLNEILDTYLVSHVAPTNKKLPVVVVLATSGDMKEEILPNWAGYLHQNSNKVKFDFWGADEIASLVEKHLLNEHIFKDVDRTDLRRSLALAGEVDYTPESLYNLFSRQLGLVIDKNSKSKSGKNLNNKIRLVNLACMLFHHWSLIQENSKSGLFAAERALLWTWHVLVNENTSQKNKIEAELKTLVKGYIEICKDYFSRMKAHYNVEDSMEIGLTDNALISIRIFEQIGILSTVGLALLAFDESDLNSKKLVDDVSRALVSVIQNNASSSSPRLDEQIIDINLAMSFLLKSGKKQIAEEWLNQLVVRIDFAFKIRKYFPLSSLDELLSEEIELETSEQEGFVYSSWTIPTLADWCAIFNREDLYLLLAQGTKKSYSRICLQLWNPFLDIYKTLYLIPSAHVMNGTSEAPIQLPDTLEQYKERIRKVLKIKNFDILTNSPSKNSIVPFIDFLAFRHFRTLVPPIMHYAEYFEK